MNSKYILVFALMLLLVGTSMAAEWDNVKSYNETTKTVTVTNLLGLGADLLTATLTWGDTEVPNGIDTHVGTFTYTPLDEDAMVDDLDLVNLKNGNVMTRGKQYKVLTYKEDDNFDWVCTTETYVNLTEYQDCVWGESGKITVEEWVPLNTFLKTNNLTVGEVYTIGVFVDTEQGDYGDWIPTFSGIEVEEWASFVVTNGAETADGAYTVITFTSNGYFNFTGDDIDMEVLVVAGGGGGGSNVGTGNGGGGGAGGLLYDASKTVSAGNYIITIGAGGAAPSNAYGGNGTNSSFDDMDARAGGGGGYYNGVDGLNGGSGGGGPQTDSIGGTGTVGQGNDGGASVSPDKRAGGGGGGAGAVGVDAATDVGGNGGVGIAYDIFNGTSLYYAGGGGGAAMSVGGVGGTGGLGGGGKGAGTTTGAVSVAGTANTGGGGGAGGNTANGDAGGSGIIIIRYLTTESSGLEVTLNSPANNTQFNTTEVTLNVTVIDDFLVQNVSLYIDGVLNDTDTSGVNGTYLFTQSYGNGDRNWSILAFDNDSFSTQSETRNFSVHYTPPNIQATYPSFAATTNFNHGESVVANWTISEADVNLSTHVNNCSLTYNGIIDYISINDCVVLNTTNFTYVSGVDEYNISVTDIFGLTNSSLATWGEQIITINSNTYTTPVYETTFQNFSTNITYNETAWDSISAELVWAGTGYSATKIGEGFGTIFFKTLSIPLLGEAVGDKYFHYVFTGINATGEYTFDSPNYTQLVKRQTFGYCNATLDDTYLNITFLDETNGSVLNAINDYVSVDYGITIGADKANFLSSDVSANQNYSFCFDPSQTVYVDFDFKYSGSGYPLRTFNYENASLTTIQTNLTLYMLSSTDGIYSSIQVAEPSGSPISDARVIMERQIAGVWVVIGDENTGDDGLVTFWVNPNYPHRITASKTGFATSQKTITPSQTLYTLTLSVSGGGGTYTSNLDGIRWVTYPRSGPIPNATVNFNTTVTAGNADLVNCKFELINASDLTQVLNSSTGITNSSYCQLILTYNTSTKTNIFGKLSINTTSTGGWVVVDADWKWLPFHQSVKGWQKITGIFSDFSTIGEFGEDNEGTYSRLMFFFIFMTILMGMLHYFTGIDITTPGISVIIIFGITLLASMAGLLTIELGNDTLGDSAFFVGKYSILAIVTLFTINYFLKTLKEDNR